MRITPTAEYSIKKYQEQYNALKEASDKVFREGLQARADLAEFYRKLEEINSRTRKSVLTKDNVDLYV